MKFSSVFLAAVFTLVSATLLPAGDIKGSKDPSGLKRYEGSRITYYEVKDYAAYELPLGRLDDIDRTTRKAQFAKSLKLEGKLTRVTYAGSDPNRSALEVFRNYQTELKENGWEILFEAGGAALSKGNGSFYAELQANRPFQTFDYNYAGAQFLSAKKGNAHLALYVANFKEGNIPPVDLRPAKGVPIVALDLIESAAMDEKMVLVKAEEMQRRIDADGSISLYGIYFDFNKDVIKPESAPTLEQIAKLLKGQPELKLYVVGHTDSVGSLESNTVLSQRRAKAVVQALSADYGIASGRLAPAGVAFLAPVATNATEEGRAKNRRVVLMPQESGK